MEDHAVTPRPSDHKLVRFLIGLTACGVIAATIHAYVWTTPTKVLARKLRSGDASVRASSARDLALSPRDLDDFRMAFDALILATTDEDMDVRAEAANALSSLVWASTNSRPGDAVPRDEVAKLLPPAQAALISGLRDREAFVRAISARGLGLMSEFGPPRIPPELLAALEDDAEVVRAAACRALMASNGDRSAAIPVILKRLETDEGADRAAYQAFAATTRPASESIPPLIESLASPRDERRAAAARMLGNALESGGPALEPLIAELRRELGARGGRRAGPGAPTDPIGPIASAVGRIANATGRSAEVLPLLIEAVGSADAPAHDAAVSAIGLLEGSGAAAVPTLLGDLRRLLPYCRGDREDAGRWEGSAAATAAALARVARGTPAEADAVRALGAGWKELGARRQVGASLLNALRSIGPRATEIYPELADDRAIGFVASPPGPNRSRRPVGVAD